MEKLKKKYARRFTFAIALVIVCLLNADSITIAKFLYSNPEARVKMSNQVFTSINDSNWKNKINQIQKNDSLSANSKESLEVIKKELTAEVNNINNAKQTLESVIPLGWKEKEFTTIFSSKMAISVILQKISGLFMTMMAIMMGAPFWFDILNKIANVRGSGTKPNEDKIK